MNRFPQYFLATIFAASGAILIWIGASLGPQLPKGAGPFYFFGAICFVIAIFSAAYKEKSPSASAPTVNVDVRNMSWLARKKYELATLDLGRLTVWGWLLLFSTGAFVVGVSIAFAQLIPNPQNKPLVRIFGLLACAGAIAWYHLGKWAATQCGVNIYRGAEDDSGNLPT